MNHGVEDIRLVDHPRSGVVYNFGLVCMYVCQTITLESFDVGSSYFQELRVEFVYEGHWVKVNVTGAEKVENSYSTAIGNNSRPIKHRAVMFACSTEFSGTADRMV